MNLEIISKQPAGRPHSTPLLFIHGMLHAAWCWDAHFLGYFAEHGYASYAVNLRGHGNSDGRDRLRWTRISDYVDDVANAIQQLPSPPVLIGHSMGGFIIQKYLEEHTAPPAVLLSSPSPNGLLPTVLRIARRHPLTFARTNLMFSLLPVIAAPELAREAFFSSDLPDERLTEYWKQMQDESYRAFLDMVVLDLPRPHKVKNRLLVLGAALDNMLSVRDIRSTARAYDAPCEIIAGVAHDSMLEPGWQSVADRILGWLTEIEPGSMRSVDQRAERVPVASVRGGDQRAGLWRSTGADHRLPQRHPAADHAEAVQRVERKIATEVNFNPSSHTLLLTHGAKTAKTIILVHGYASSPAPFKEIAARLFDRGYNVLAMPLPYHGLADRMNTEHEKLRAEDFVRYADRVVDIARGLGDHVTMLGLSCGALITGWAAQQRQDVDLAVLISPGFGFKAVPRLWTPLMGWAWRVLPNTYIWDDPVRKADNPRACNYLRLSTHALGQILRLSGSIQALARRKAPAATAILVITNRNDPSVDNRVTDQVVDAWRDRSATKVETYEFPAELGLGHDIISVDDPNMNVPVVYSKLLELIDR